MLRLRILSGSRRGETFLLPDAPTEPVRVGRGHDAQLRVPDDTTMSRVHAELVGEGGAWTLVNHSQHGTLVGRKRVDARQTLQAGDVLVLGETQVIFETAPGTGTGPDDPLTPATPTIALANSAAGFDTEGMFHMGHTMLGLDADVEGSFIHFGKFGGRPGIKVKTRRVYFFLVVAILGLAGCLSTGVFIVLPTLADHAQLLLKATSFGLLPVFPYILLIKALDRNDQVPWSNVLACLAWGATVGCGFALVGNAIFGSAVTALIDPEAAWNATAVLVAPVVEELVKGLAVLFVFWILRDELDNGLEGLVLGAASGLGFAVVENCIYNVGFLRQPGGEETMIAMGTYRTVVNALIGHPVYTAMTGLGLGLLREVSRRNRWRALLPLGGFLLAVTLHLVWNGAAIAVTRALGKDNTPQVLVVNTLVFGGAGVAFFVMAYLVGLSRERRVLLTYLAEEVGRGFILPEELKSFERLFGRHRWELEGLLRGGWRVFRERRAMRRAQVELAFRKWHLAQGEAPRGNVVDAYVLSARTRIRDGRNRLRALDPLSARLPASAEAEPPTVQPDREPQP